ncbi:P-loop containing nucleoside triphosphate hydrolase protein [Cantharellus anzutake]|uniref:P-loop containing nucleoside triphosphate hydrolase protein n=1 Tax=Cantharellus anzutake TaxID=1750568 RepID=UPI001904999C|nr:P-loop containing nucleoside triphosphate hydrolase protein [Cantharellus anzutake]KAF8342729.1 P-loop containing nucleoside triphosphate hydrolase protein [Cantharellus anzutake]
MVQWFTFLHSAQGPKNRSGIYLVCQSNVGVKNIAEKLESIGFTDWRLIVSNEFKFEWHEHLYEKIKEYVIESTDLPRSMVATKKLLGEARVILCTLSMFTSEKMDRCGITRALAVPEVLIVDEASQVLVNEYMTCFTNFCATLRRVCFVGDDKQRKWAKLLRLPIGDFLSREVYNNELHSCHGITSVNSVRFIDVSDGAEAISSDSTQNVKEIDAVVYCVRQLSAENKDLRVITPYDAQRNEIEKRLREENLKWEETVFNVDSFQGNECDFIIISIVRTILPGFLEDQRRMNVMLSRARKGMIITANKSFLLRHPDLLVTKLAASLETEWIPARDLQTGIKMFNDEVRP